MFASQSTAIPGLGTRLRANAFAMTAWKLAMRVITTTAHHVNVSAHNNFAQIPAGLFSTLTPVLANASNLHLLRALMEKSGVHHSVSAFVNLSNAALVSTGTHQVAFVLAFRKSVKMGIYGIYLFANATVYPSFAMRALPGTLSPVNVSAQTLYAIKISTSIQRHAVANAVLKTVALKCLIKLLAAASAHLKTVLRLLLMEM